jgi:hypothetical protein
MAYSSGTFSRLYDFTDDRDNGIRIQAARMDAELDGMATGLTTAILKDGSQTTTAVVPFAYGISIVDNQSATFGTTSDYTLQYDETTRDSLFLTSNVEGAAFKLTLAADQGDDASDEWQVGISTSGVLTIGNDIASAQTYVSQLTLTPHATVASSTTAVLGNLTVGGSLSLGSAVIAEAELEMLDGITAGTVIASKALVADANIDITGGRNITITGELAAATLDISGNIDIDGTANLDIVDIDGAVNIAATTTIDGANKVQFRDTGLYIHSSTDGQLDIVSDTKTQINSATIELTGIVNIAGLTTVTAANKIQFRDTGLYINSSADGQLDIVADTEIQIAATTIDINGAVALNGAITGATNITLTGELDAATGDFSGDVDVDGTLEADAITIGGTAVGSIFSPIAGGTGILTTGALNAGSITSGFGAIDNGASAITTTGVGSFGSLDISGDIDVDGITNLDVVDIDGAVDMATTLAVAGNVDFNGDLDVDGTTNLDVVDIDGAVDMATTLAVTGIATFTDDIIIGDGKTIGSASDVDAITIHSNGVVSASAGVALGVGTANTASNVLDDYEEGTWTPSLGGTTTYSGQSGKYTKVGNLVHVTGQIAVTLIGDGSTNLISGLPFTSATTINGNPPGVLGVSYYANLSTAMIWVSGYVTSNSTAIAITGNTVSSSTIQHNTVAVYQDTSRIDFNMTYYVA